MMAKRGRPKKMAEGSMPEVVQFELPVAEPAADAYLPRHVEIGFLSPKQRKNMKRLVEGFDRTGKRLENDKRVVSCADAIRAVLESF
jgi:hypothetical protein